MRFFTKDLFRKIKAPDSQTLAGAELKHFEHAMLDIPANVMANMGHELRTPFNAIIGFTELILDRQFGDLTPLQEEYMGDVLDSARNLLALINDLLDITSVDGDKLMKLDPSPVKLDDLFPRCVALVKEKAAKHGIKLSTDINPADEIIEADERRLKHVFFSLLTCALTLTPDGGQVRLSAKTTEKDVRISVEHTACGIKHEDLECLLSAFEDPIAPSNHSCQRTLPVLYTTRKLVELHGGRIWTEIEDENKSAGYHFLIPKKQNVEYL